MNIIQEGLLDMMADIDEAARRNVAQAQDELAKAQELEGVVAKRRDSRYYFDKRTKDWIKIKYLKDEDFVVCGYLRKESRVGNTTTLPIHMARNGGWCASIDLGK